MSTFFIGGNNMSNIRTLEEKERIIKEYLNGKGIRTIEKEHQVRNAQVYRWLEKYEKYGIEGLNQFLNKIKEEKIEDQIILHTDQGPVYSSKKYNNLLNNFNIQRSMSRAGTPTDNPVNESLNGWIKEELFIDFDLKHSKDVPSLIKLYIEYYNNERPSYSLNYKTPIQYKTESGF